MRLSIALGITAAALTVAVASAQSVTRQVVVRHGAADINIDANEDGWITRAEASSAYERIFGDLDINDDGKLDAADHAQREHVGVFRGDGGEVRVFSGDMDEQTRARIERDVDAAMRRAEIEVERAERDAERAERDAERAEREVERTERRVQVDSDGNREVIIIRNSEGGGSWTTLNGEVAPLPPAAPAPFMMLIANSEEADRNGDGALSREEFVAQHLRFFDASDANGDGRVRFDPPPHPPEPPVAPAAPEAPRRR